MANSRHPESLAGNESGEFRALPFSCHARHKATAVRFRSKVIEKELAGITSYACLQLSGHASHRNVFSVILRCERSEPRRMNGPRRAKNGRASIEVSVRSQVNSGRRPSRLVAFCDEHLRVTVRGWRESKLDSRATSAAMTTVFA
jgi:hypothetical protein